MKKHLFRVSAVLAVLGLLAGSGGVASGASDDAGAAADTSEPGGSEPGDGVGPDTPWVTEGVDRDASIRIGTFSPMTGADPHAFGATVNTLYYNLMYDRLLWVGRDSELQPYLATDWEFIDGALVLTLRDDATFQDGSPIDAAAVQANLEFARTDESSAYQAQLASIESIDAVDEHTVRLNLAPNSGATLPYVLGGWAGMIVNPEFLDPELLKTSAPDGVGSGPYKVVEWIPGEDTVVLERAEGHWDAAAGQAARIEMVFVADATQAVNSVTAGDLDLTAQGGLAGVEAINQAESSPDEVQAGGWIDAYSSSGALTMADHVDPIVREAMRYAVDRDALIAIHQGSATVSTQIFPDGHPAYVDEIDELNVYDPDKARELIATAPEGSTSLTMGYVEAGMAPPTATLFQAQLSDVGIDLELVPMTQSSRYEAWFDGQFDILSSGFAGPAHASTGIDAILLRGGINWGAPDSALPEIQEQLTQADDPALSEDERIAIYRDILRNAAEETWLLVFNLTKATTYASADLVNAGPEVPFEYQSLPDFRYVARKAS